jgi:hypothetical protein
LTVATRPDPPLHPDWVAAGSAVLTGSTDDTDAEFTGGVVASVPAKAGTAVPTLAARTAAEAAPDMMIRRLFTTHSIFSS